MVKKKKKMVKKMVEKNVSDFEQEKEQIPTTKTNQNQTSVVCCFRLFFVCLFVANLL